MIKEISAYPYMINLKKDRFLQKWMSNMMTTGCSLIDFLAYIGAEVGFQIHQKGFEHGCMVVLAVAVTASIVGIQPSTDVATVQMLTGPEHRQSGKLSIIEWMEEALKPLQAKDGGKGVFCATPSH